MHNKIVQGLARWHHRVHVLMLLDHSLKHNRPIVCQKLAHLFSELSRRGCANTLDTYSLMNRCEMKKSVSLYQQ